LPAICDLLAAERASGTLFDVEAAIPDQRGQAVADAPAPSATPAPSVAPTPSAAPAPVPAVAPALIAPSRATPLPPDTIDVENHAVATARHAVEGVAAISVTLLSGLQPLAAAARKQLEMAVASGTCDAKWVATMLESLATSLAKSSNSLARLVEAQSVLSDRPTQTVRVERTEAVAPSISDAEARRRAELITETMFRRARELEAEETAPASNDIREAEIVA
jgi:hypothetical protein